MFQFSIKKKLAGGRKKTHRITIWVQRKVEQIRKNDTSDADESQQDRTTNMLRNRLRKIRKTGEKFASNPEARKRLLKQTANCETLENMKTVSCAGRAAEWKWRAHWICADNRFENMCKFCDSIMKFNFSLELSLFTRVFWDISNRIQRDSSDNKTEVVKLKLINWKFRLKMREMKMIRMAMNFSRQFALRSYIADVVGNKPWYTEKGYTWIEKLDWREVYSSREENPCSRRESLQQKRIQH